jgi:hypothetical protein
LRRWPELEGSVVSRLEERLVRSIAGWFRRDRLAGAKILGASLLLGLAGVLPLLLYSVLGPEHGNPIGLGLLAVAAVGMALIGAAVGGLGLLVGLLARLRR